MEDITPIEEIRELVAKEEKVPTNIFDKPKEETETTHIDKKNELVEQMFEQAVVHQVANDEELKGKVLDTAKQFTETKMQTIETNVNTEFLEANFNNKKDACESYGFNEKTTPVWATKVMSWGYNVMLAIWLFVCTFTLMPVIFITKKISVGLKKTWIAILFALIIYLSVTFVPILVTLIK